MQTGIIECIVSLRPMLLTAILICLIMYFFVLLRMKKISLKGNSDWIASLFVGLNGRSLLHTACALVKFALFSAILLTRTKMTAELWELMAALLFAVLVMRINLNMLLNEIVGGALQGAGLTVCSYLLEYLRTIRHTGWISASYWLAAAVLIVCSLLIFVREITVISSERTSFDETGESE